LPDGRLIGHGGSHQSLYVTSLNTDAAADALPVISINGNELSSTGTGTFQWFLNGQIITGPTASTFTPTQNGDYTVTMTVSADCEFTSDPYTLLNVGVSELAGSPIHIANNPVSDMLVVLNNGGVVRYEVLGIEGQRISTGQLQAGRNEIDMNGTASGVYLLRTELKGSIATQRIVKQ
ncbi:MAG: T9SS type A sorting domain-containing protein, partial [Flavobacteriales bacterium]